MANRLVPLTTVFSVMEARVLVSKLEAYRIHAVAPVEFVSVSPHLMTAHGGVRILVLERDLDAARALAQPSGEAAPLPPRRRMLEALAGLVVLVQGVPPAPVPAFARSQLWFAGPLAAVLVAAGLLTFLPNLFAGVLLFGSTLE